eukprot:692099-Pyramimonas_sp.AAC.1
MLCCARLRYAVLCYAKAQRSYDEDDTSNAKLRGRSCGGPRGGCRGNRPGRVPLPGLFKIESTQPSRQNL